MPNSIEWFALAIVAAVIITIIFITMYKTRKDERETEAKDPREQQERLPITNG